MRKLTIDLGGRQWHIHLTPGSLELVATGIITCCLAVAFGFALMARRRAKQAEAAVEALRAESLERSRTEESLRDITGRKQREEQNNARLARTNQQLTLRNQQLEQSTRLMSEFLTGMSHELRTPLHTIIGFSELLAEELEGPLNEKQHRFIDHVHRDALHLLDLINALLDLSKIEAGKLELKLTQFDLKAVVEEILASIRVRSDAKSIAIQMGIESDMEVYADRLRLKQILLNLLSNAVKFTLEGGRIEITSKRVDGAIEIAVRDSGPGIPPQAQASIFDKFYQIATSVNGENQGTGLGLAITKALVEQHRGRIWLESEVGRGSCFTFSLPTRAAASA